MHQGSIDEPARDYSGSMAKFEPSRSKKEPKVATTFKEMFIEWPKITFCIIGNEFCERFSFYGMRTVLTLYLLNVLKFSDDDSTVFFNCFTAFCYFSPVLGSIIADGFIGKFKTIFIVSMFYSFGQCILAFTSTYNSKWSMHPYLDFVGLLIIALGTGGIKPCVSPFGGDQFEKHQVHMISLFFSVFYFSINAGSMISTFISPIFRATPCMGQDSCYPMAFGVPAALMITATVIFMLGSCWYKKPPVETNVLADTAGVIFRALVGRTKPGPKKGHWLDYALYNHYCTNSDACLKLKRRRHSSAACARQEFVDDVKTLIRVSVMFLPLPVFWSLYDQQGSVWLIQSLQMDCRIWGNTLLLPDQMQTLNAVLILIFIPVFSGIIYPFCGLFCKVTPLRKMSAGGLLAAVAFVISAFLQLRVNTTLPQLPNAGEVYISAFNNIPDCNVTIANSQNSFVAHVGPFEALENDDRINTMRLKKENVTFQFTYAGKCPTDLLPVQYDADLKTRTPVGYIYFGLRGVFLADAATKKPSEGTGEHAVSVVIDINDVKNYTDNLAWCRVSSGADVNHPCNPRQASDFYYYEVDYDEGASHDVQGYYSFATNNGITPENAATVFKSKPVKPGHWKLYYLKETPKSVGKQTPPKENITVSFAGVEYERNTQGGVYVVAVSGSRSQPNGATFTVVPDNRVNILWQVPQIAVITAAEILFSITGLEFSYTEAAPSMKSVVGALFLLTTAAGDLMIVVITKLSPSNNMAVQFFFYAGLMTVVMVVFVLLAVFYYDYASFTDVVASRDEDGNENENEGKNGSAMHTGRAQPLRDGLDGDDDAWQVRL